MSAPRAFAFIILVGYALPHDNTHFEHHSWLDRAGKFRAADHPTVCCMDNLIVSPLYKAISKMVFAVSVDDIVKTL